MWFAYGPFFAAERLDIGTVFYALALRVRDSGAAFGADFIGTAREVVATAFTEVGTEAFGFKIFVVL